MNAFQKKLWTAIGLLAAFILWTAMLFLVDVQPIGPTGSSVGFAHLNQAVHNITGVHWGLYHITDWLGLVPVAVCLCFGVLGLVQWIKRKSIRKVDSNIFVLGGFYILTIAAYLFFENFIVNYRPVLINDFLEVSYPSSTTMLVLCVMPTAALQLHSRIRSKRLRRIVTAIIFAFIAFMVIGRLLSGVHWFSDIIGGILLSASLVTLYDCVSSLTV